MCKLKSGANLQTDGELQNLVTGIILRQTKPFTVQNIMDSLEGCIKGSRYEDSYDTVKKMTLRTIEDLEMSDCIQTNYRTHQYRLFMSFPAATIISKEPSFA